MFIGSKYQSSVSFIAYNQYQYQPWKEVAGGCAYIFQQPIKWPKKFWLDQTWTKLIIPCQKITPNHTLQIYIMSLSQDLIYSKWLSCSVSAEVVLALYWLRDFIKKSKQNKNPNLFLYNYSCISQWTQQQKPKSDEVVKKHGIMGVVVLLKMYLNICLGVRNANICKQQSGYLPVRVLSSKQQVG